MKNRFSLLLATAIAIALLALPFQSRAVVGPATATTTINVTVAEAVSVSVTPSSITAAYTGGSLTLSPITVNSSWSTNGSEHEFIIYCSFGSANALNNGGSSIPSSAIIANVTGTAPINGLFSSGFAPTIGGNLSNTLQDQITVPNAVFIFSASVDGKVAPGIQQWPATPQGSATNQVTLVVTPTGSLNPGTYTGVLTFTALAQ